MSALSRLELRSLALHRLVIAKIRADPELMAKVRATLLRWQGMVDERTQPYLTEWESILEYGIDRCLSVAVEETEYACALRKSSPFTAILTEEERSNFLKTWADKGS